MGDPDPHFSKIRALRFVQKPLKGVKERLLKFKDSSVQKFFRGYSPRFLHIVATEFKSTEYTFFFIRNLDQHLVLKVS